jgi:predicted metal-dependent enzyme (double-stranded beta helix superfamily)
VTLTVDDVVARCRSALAEHTPQLAMRDVLEGLIADADALERAVGAVEVGGITTLHHAPDLTILRVAWTPGIALNPHEHRMWAAIAMYGGQEDNAFYRRSAHGLDPSGGKEITAGEVLLLGDDVIHSVSNTRREFAVALHVYGGDFYAVERSEWDFGTYEERPRDFERTRRVFEEANARWREQSG